MSRLTRRHLLSTAAVSGIIGGALTRFDGFGGTAHDPTEADGWRHPQATPGNSAAIDVTGPRSADGVDWRRRIENPLPHRFRGLVRHGETLVVPTHRRLYGVSTDGDRQFTSVLSSDYEFDYFDREPQIDSDPRVFGDRYFVVSQSMLYGIDLTDGQPRWIYDPDGGIDGLVLLGNTFYLNAGYGSNANLLAVAATNGERRWRKPGRLVPLVATPDLLVGATYGDGVLYGIDPATGDQRWQSDRRVSASSFNAGTIGLVDDTLWHTHDGHLTAIDATTGDERWTVDLEGDGSSFADRFAVADGIYVVEPEYDRLEAFELAGERRWSRDLQDAAAGIAVADDTAYVATSDGLEAVATADGTRRFRVAPAETPGEALTPLVTEDAVYGLSGETLYGVSEP